MIILIVLLHVLFSASMLTCYFNVHRTFETCFCLLLLLQMSTIHSFVSFSSSISLFIHTISLSFRLYHLFVHTPRIHYVICLYTHRFVWRKKIEANYTFTFVEFMKMCVYGDCISKQNKKCWRSVKIWYHPKTHDILRLAIKLIIEICTLPQIQLDGYQSVGFVAVCFFLPSFTVNIDD